MSIVAIGGGDIHSGGTLAIDKFIVNLAGKQSPKALFVPTASGDAKGYCNNFDRIYKKKLGCQTEHLLLLSQNTEKRLLKEKILGADIIYVGGGNTLRMMKRWRSLGVDGFLKKAHQKGAILAGISAGAICWHEWGHSDSRSFSGSSEWSHIRVRALGFCPGIFCPHLDKEKRHRSFSAMIQRRGGLGISCDNNAAVYYQKNKKPIVKCSHKKATARIYRRKSGKVKFEIYRCGEELEIE